MTFADGAVINLGVSYALPARYPTLGQSDRVELLGTANAFLDTVPKVVTSLYPRSSG